LGQKEKGQRMIPDLSNLRNLVFDREGMPSPSSLGIDLSNLPTIDPGTIKKMPATTTGGVPGSAWWQDAGYPDAATAIQSGNFRYDMNTGWQLKPSATTPAMELAEPVTPEPAFVAPPEVIQSAIENLPVTIGAMTSPDLGRLGTSGMSMMEDEPITMTSDLTMSPMIESEVTPMDSDIDRMIEKTMKEAMASGDVPVQAADDPILTIDPVQAAVDAAVGNGQPTTDDTILDKDTMEGGAYLSYSGSDEGGDYIVANGKKTYLPDFSITDDTILDPDDMVVGAQIVTPYYNPATGETFTQYNTAQPVPEGFIPGSPPETPAQPDFMTQLQELIAQMQGEQTAAAEAAAAAEAERQKQTAEMTQNYMVGQPAVGYNPYESGQYQNNPYGSAGVPDMGGITSIPVPAAYTPYQPPGGTT